jgi:hypothetical protein
MQMRVLAWDEGFPLFGRDRNVEVDPASVPGSVPSTGEVVVGHVVQEHGCGEKVHRSRRAETAGPTEAAALPSPAVAQSAFSGLAQFRLACTGSSDCHPWRRIQRSDALRVGLRSGEGWAEGCSGEVGGDTAVLDWSPGKTVSQPSVNGCERRRFTRAYLEERRGRVRTSSCRERMGAFASCNPPRLGDRRLASR